MLPKPFWFAPSKTCWLDPGPPKRQWCRLSRGTFEKRQPLCALLRRVKQLVDLDVQFPDFAIGQVDQALYFGNNCVSH